ncbi:GIP [Symbiodinium necroappetens]|uniref:GIP protein n=1 Tax=Symbiodinium necroappetens TaxID=1628268 RepID=A0A813B3Y1_9DINO|nr:GIP [Symbiodinium necroappetens]
MKGCSEEGAEDLESATPQVTREGVMFTAQELGYVQSLADPCVYFLHDDNKTGWDKLVGIVSVATDDMLHGGDETHQAKMQLLNQKYKLGKFQYGSGRFTGKQFTLQGDGSIVVDQFHYVSEKVHKIPLSRIRDIISANQLASEAEKFQVGIRISPIPITRLRVSAVTDASWGNAEGAGSTEDSGRDFWIETQDHWIRKHVQPRRTLFHPGMVDNGPDLHTIEASRTTYFNQDNQESKQEVTWNGNQVSLVAGSAWTGQTVFVKSNKGLDHTEISEKFLQNRRTSSQGGHLLIFHDQDLQCEPSAAVTISSWKSYKLKRKVVNTLSAECQALASGIGNVHWHRFLLLEAQGGEFTDQDWERSMTKERP